MTTRSAIWFLVLCAAAPVLVPAQASNCSAPHTTPQANALEQQQWENGSSPVYADATELARTLNERGFVVECIRRSVEERLFKGQKGAAWFKTNQGVFEVWFLPEPAAAAAVVAKVTARPPSINLPSGPSEFFIQHQNVVFHVGMGQKALAASIQTALQKP